MSENIYYFTFSFSDPDYTNLDVEVITDPTIISILYVCSYSNEEKDSHKGIIHVSPERLFSDDSDGSLDILISDVSLLLQDLFDLPPHNDSESFVLSESDFTDAWEHTDITDDDIYMDDDGFMNDEECMEEEDEEEEDEEEEDEESDSVIVDTYSTPSASTTSTTTTHPPPPPSVPPPPVPTTAACHPPPIPPPPHSQHFSVSPLARLSPAVVNRQPPFPTYSPPHPPQMISTQRFVQQPPIYYTSPVNLPLMDYSYNVSGARSQQTSNLRPPVQSPAVVNRQPPFPTYSPPHPPQMISTQAPYTRYSNFRKY